MALPTHVFATANPGKLVPISPSDGAGPGGALLLVEPGMVCRLAWSTDGRRAWRRGDLALTDHTGKPAADELAAKANEVPDGFEEHGAVIRPVHVEPTAPAAAPKIEPTAPAAETRRGGAS